MNSTCISFCTADAYDMDCLNTILKKKNLISKSYDNVIHLEDLTTHSHAFIFHYGCVVFWGFNKDNMTDIINLIKDCAIDPLPHNTSDECRFHYSEGGETLINEEEDLVILESEDPLILLAISYALSQSVKLKTFENSTFSAIQRSKDLPNELSRTGSIRLSRRKLSRIIGSLFEERHSINLHTDLLDTPEFFWKRPKYESYYKEAAEYMDITTRTMILNQRLTVLHELYDMLSDEMKHRHSSRLEWIIILLIAIEIIMSALHYLHKGTPL